jgi:hypothetical protein
VDESAPYKRNKDGSDKSDPYKSNKEEADKSDLYKSNKEEADKSDPYKNATLNLNNLNFPVYFKKIDENKNE